MSSPVRSWSLTTTAWASLNCSRYHGSIIAVSSGRPHMFCVYQRGRGHDPVTVAGSIRSFVAVNAIGRLLSSRRRVVGAPGPCKLDDLDPVAVGVLHVDAFSAPVGAARRRHRA